MHERITTDSEKYVLGYDLRTWIGTINRVIVSKLSLVPI